MTTRRIRPTLMTRWTPLAMAVALASGCIIPTPPKTPAQAPVTKSMWLDQGWSDFNRHWYHHADQGTANFVIPYDWFMALEQPDLKPFGTPGLVSDLDYIESFSFIPSKVSEQFNPDGLPVGFIKAKDQLDPVVNRRTDQIGLTCAACHTGQLSYNGTAIYIDGGPAIAGVTDFTKAVGMSVIFLDKIPGRFGRFADRLLGPDASAEQKDQLKSDLKKYVAQFRKIADLTTSVAKDSINEGFGRLDALDRIGNQVFSISPGKDENFVPIAAPVAYPHIWMSPWFSWVQYDASIMQPMVRNAGEALGVAAPINLQHPGPDQYKSEVKMAELQWMEDQLTGATHPVEARGLTGLRAPKWPEEVLGTIDHDLAARGAKLYAQHCQGCHLPAAGSEKFWTDEHWRPIAYDSSDPKKSGPSQTAISYLDLKVIDHAQIGTDPAQWQSLNHRTVDVDGLNIEAELDGFGIPIKDGQAPFGFALAAVVERTIDDWAARQEPPIEGEARWALDGNRPNQIQAPKGYKARPLDGVWATPPFLHNGSVPTVYDLLSPAADRPARFWLGSRSYDPAHLGYEHGELKNATLIDTSIAGNHNTGHEFNRGFDASRAKEAQGGLIGPYLEPAERLALIEFLKTL